VKQAARALSARNAAAQGLAPQQQTYMPGAAAAQPQQQQSQKLGRAASAEAAKPRPAKRQRRAGERRVNAAGVLLNCAHTAPCGGLATRDGFATCDGFHPRGVWLRGQNFPFSVGSDACRYCSNWLTP